MTAFIWFLTLSSGLILAGLLIAIIRFKLAQIDMTFFEFSRRLVTGGGYKNISPQVLDTMLRLRDKKLQIIDLRDKKESKTTPIPDSILSPFDEFLKDVVVHKKYRPDDTIVLYCDTGHMSRVAGTILAEDEGFTNVFSLKGGIENWKRWQKRASKTSSCHTIGKLAECCR